MVYFVGAGSGAVDLITVRGQRLIESADVIIYAGSLVNKELLNSAKENTLIFNSATMTLYEVVEQIIKADQRGLEVVRLHTGDPSLFGAVKEQFDVLTANNINFEVVPGVSSFSAVAAALKAEYTLPGVSQSLIITRFPGKTPAPNNEFKKLSQVGCSMAIFLSMGLIGELTTELCRDSAYNEKTPAAIVYKASWEDQKIFRCSIKELFSVATENNITKTAMIVVGNFLECDYQLSKLYDESFETEFRKAKNGC